MAPYAGIFQVESCVGQDEKGRYSWGVQVVDEVSLRLHALPSEP